METTDLAIKVFVAGVTGVFVVMVLLQVFIYLSSKLAIWLDAKSRKIIRDTQ